MSVAAAVSVARSLMVPLALATASALAACAAEIPVDAPAPPIAVARGRFDTPEHTAASVYANQNACPGSPRYLTDAEAGKRGNDPDCVSDDCDKSPPSSGDSDCWACRNMEHFTAHGFDDLPTNTDAEDRMLGNAASSKGAGDMGNAQRWGHRACHFVLDRNACGHAGGNFECDPRLEKPTDSCKAWVKRVYDELYPLFTWTEVAQYKATTLCGVRAACGGALAGSGYGATDGLAWAAAERYLRHHSRGRYNSCPATCGSGECPVAGAPPLGELCKNEIESVCTCDGDTIDRTLPDGTVTSVCSDPTTCTECTLDGMKKCPSPYVNTDAGDGTCICRRPVMGFGGGIGFSSESAQTKIYRELCGAPPRLVGESDYGCAIFSGGFANISVSWFKDCDGVQLCKYDCNYSCPKIKKSGWRTSCPILPGYEASFGG